MTDNDNFLDLLRTDARQLRYEPDEMMSNRIAARVRERIAAESQTGIAQMLARWFRPVVVSLATLALVATLGIQWAEQAHDASATSLDSMTSTQTVDISVGGDTFSVE
ncbi:MAG TPA: hypothetical protein VGQ65_00815 [Thermoanaerobaculia bacterium]|jgi:hypothetical protein|nr:hypothetical protein [Thermoanaerobaculia bacterium]